MECGIEPALDNGWQPCRFFGRGPAGFHRTGVTTLGRNHFRDVVSILDGTSESFIWRKQGTNDDVGTLETLGGATWPIGSIGLKEPRPARRRKCRILDGWLGGVIRQQSLSMFKEIESPIRQLLRELPVVAQARADVPQRDESGQPFRASCENRLVNHHVENSNDIGHLMDLLPCDLPALRARLSRGLGGIARGGTSNRRVALPLQ